jgi:putative ABC transport system permease protein
MIFTDFKIAFRNLKRNRVTSAISIVGLGIGLVSIILLMALIIHETSFDKFIAGYKNIYRVNFGQDCYTNYPLAEEMKKDFPEVKNFFRIDQMSDFELRDARNELVKEKDFAFSDSSIFKVLGIKIIEGRQASSVSEVAISEKMAKKYFGNSTPLGNILKIKFVNDVLNLSVTGVYKDFPSNSTLSPEFISDVRLTDKVLVEIEHDIWGEYGNAYSTFLNWDVPVFYTYVVLDKNADREKLLTKMARYNEFQKFEVAKKKKYSFQPLSDIYLKSGSLVSTTNFCRTGNSNQIIYYWSISFLILIISVANYIFLTRASITGRLREIGTRKVLGASHNNIRSQIILESSLVTILSLIPGLFLFDSGISFINNTLGKTLSRDVFYNPLMWLAIILVVLFVGIVAGLSIGSRISRIPPKLLLSSKISEKSGSSRWNHSFLIFHFSLYIILVVSVLTISKQIRYSQTNIMGINPKNVLITKLKSIALKSNYKTICSEMEKFPGVQKIAGSSDIPPIAYFMPIALQPKPDVEPIKYDGLFMGEGLSDLLGLEVIEGSTFGEWHPAPELIFNESAAKKFNIQAGSLYMGMHVQGIVRDFNAHSLHTLIQPMVIMQQNPTKMRNIAIKTDGTNDQAIIKKLGEVCASIDPNQIFEVTRLTDDISDFYSDDKNQGNLIMAFSFLAAILAVMGLFGIALISIARKTKEIGLRKVNGASVGEILYIINRDFIKSVLLAILIGISVSYFIASSWETRFAYKTQLNWWIFATAGISAILIAVLTVSWQSWRAATRNPVDALRYE